MRFILDDQRDPQPCPSLSAWIDWLEAPTNWDQRRVAYDHLAGVQVLTYFTGIDLRLEGDPPSPPVLYETQVWRGPDLDVVARYATRTGARAGHLAQVATLEALNGVQAR